ncbi:hypothetical protein GWG65_15865 [Bradyrhizobium sp. CSA207]|nr:hypothetical protein [Bradyrhizobium sp. CSA207]
MPQENAQENDLKNDLEGKSDMGGKHGGQAGQPKLLPRPREHERDEDVVAKRHTGQTDRRVPPTNKNSPALRPHIRGRPPGRISGNGSHVPRPPGSRGRRILKRRLTRVLDLLGHRLVAHHQRHHVRHHRRPSGRRAG